MPETYPPIDLARLSLTEIAALVADRRLPPVESWNPARSGDSEMRIAADGSWYHQGGRIDRPAMVRLFATILRREPDGGYVLVTPAEKLSIVVEDAPFVAVELRTEGHGRDRQMAFRLNTDDIVVAGPDHRLRIEERDDGPHPYVGVRAGLDALIARPLYYELIDLALEEDADPPGLWSAGGFFALDGR
ncbi:MAG: hypothetical protein JWR77_824 [Rhizorhabdus sp.]|nr:hypothetical protein [Rhizorhabdus sp.]